MTQKKTKTKKKFEKKAPAEGGEVVKEEKKDIDEHPLANGHYLIVKYRDGSDRLVRVRKIYHSSLCPCIHATLYSSYLSI